MPKFIRSHWAIAVLMAVAMTATIVPGCASTPNSDATPEQAYYEAKAQWNTVLAAVVVYAGTPLGQSRPDILIQIQAVGYRVAGVFAEIDIAMCYHAPATVFDPAPPPHPECVPLNEAAANRRFEFAARMLTIAISEIGLLQLPEEGS